MSIITIVMLLSFVNAAKAARLTELLLSMNSSAGIYEGLPKIWQVYIKSISHQQGS